MDLNISHAGPFSYTSSFSLVVKTKFHTSNSSSIKVGSLLELLCLSVFSMLWRSCRGFSVSPNCVCSSSAWWIRMYWAWVRRGDAPDQPTRTAIEVRAFLLNPLVNFAIETLQQSSFNQFNKCRYSFWALIDCWGALTTRTTAAALLSVNYRACSLFSSTFKVFWYLSRSVWKGPRLFCANNSRWLRLLIKKTH